MKKSSRVCTLVFVSLLCLTFCYSYGLAGTCFPETNTLVICPEKSMSGLEGTCDAGILTYQKCGQVIIKHCKAFATGIQFDPTLVQSRIIFQTDEQTDLQKDYDFGIYKNLPDRVNKNEKPE